jgi:TPR repeat protein
MVNTVFAESPGIECTAFIKQGENYKIAHTNQDCIKAADLGGSSAQYSLGMSYGFANKPNLEEKYYRLAANQGNIASYLALGHALRQKNVWESIYWYQRFVATKADGYGYAAVLLSGIFNELGDSAQSKYWKAVCERSPYQDCDVK